jgi:predicted PurR-regulated permease PerM
MTQLDISWASLWRIVAVGFVAVLAVLSWQILLALFLAIVISAGLDFMVDWLERRGLPRALGVVAIFVCAALVFIVVAYAVIPQIIGDLATMVGAFDEELAETWLVPLESSKGISSIFSAFSSKLLSGGSEGFQAAAASFEPIAIIATILVSAFYLSLSKDGIESFIRTVFPASYEAPALRVYHRSRRKIGNWFRTQVLLGVLVGTLTWFCLWMIGVEQAAVFGLLAGICELVPLLGPIVAGVVAVGVTLVTAPLSAIWVFLVFFAIHQIEANVLVPLLTRQAVGLHPVVVITALLLGYQIAGIMGTLAAVPLAAVVQEALEEVTRQRRRAAEDRVPLPG